MLELKVIIAAASAVETTFLHFFDSELAIEYLVSEQFFFSSKIQ